MTIHISIVGLPRSGKTTFLAALWHLLEAGEVETDLVLDKMIGDNRHLTALADAWRKCEAVPRTSQQLETSVSMRVHEKVTGRRAIVEFPDLSGESFKGQIVRRACSTSYLENLNSSNGLLMFISANRSIDGLTILDLLPLFKDAPDQKTVTESREAADKQRVKKWTIDVVPQQVCIVELLQFLQRSPFRRNARRLAILISAWDLVESDGIAPLDWLKREMPFLNQFLSSNAKSFELRVYGVSAQGGQFSGPERKKLLGTVPSKRIRCIGPEAGVHDISAPVRWLMATTNNE